MGINANTIRGIAREAADKYFEEKLNGVDQFSCGFAWVSVTPDNKGNTRLGKEERRDLEFLGFKKDWTGKTWQLWNPSGHPCQNIDTKEAGARAAAEYLKGYGFKAYAGSRLD